MDHAYFKDRLSALYDNELPPQEKQIVEEHLRDCADCQQELEQLRKLDEAVTRHAQLAETDYWEKSAQKIEQRLGFEQPTVITPVHRKWYERGLAWKAVAAAASIAVIAYIGINSEKILKRENLEPQLRMTTPAMTPPRPERRIEADSVGEQQYEIGLPAKDEESKGVVPKKAQPVSPRKKVPPVVVKTPSSEPTDINLSNQALPVEDAYLPAGDQKPETSQYSSGRAAAAPTALGQESAKTLMDTAVVKPGDEMQKVIVAQIDTAVTDTMLTYWRKKRDALAFVRKTLPGVAAFDALEKSAAPTNMRATEKEQPKLTPREVEKQMLEAWYHIARLTTDSPERDEAIAEIRKVAENRKSANHASAVEYLKELGEQ